MTLLVSWPRTQGEEAVGLYSFFPGGCGLLAPDLCSPGRLASAMPGLHRPSSGEEKLAFYNKTKRPPRDFMQSADLLQDVLLACSKEQLGAFSSLLKTITADYIDLRGIDDEPLGRY